MSSTEPPPGSGQPDDATQADPAVPSPGSGPAPVPGPTATPADGAATSGVTPPPPVSPPPPPPPTPQANQPPPPTPRGRGRRGGRGEGWYNGPLPIAELAPRETIGSAIGRTAIKALTVLAVVMLGLFLIPVVLIGIGAALGGGGEVESPTTPRTVVAGEAGADIRLAAVPVTGLILGEDRNGTDSLFGAIDATYGYTIKEELEALADVRSIDGIVLEIDSPGGTIFGSRAIADGVAAYREKSGGKPVIAFVGGISASGGMYAMAGADEIYADHGTLIGSIGVIFGPFERYNDVTAIDGGLLGGGVTTEGGIEVEFLTAGRSKDLGNPYRPMTPEERAVLQEGLDQAYDEFVGHVADGRDLTPAEIETKLGALLFGEQQALANGLIDGIADRDAAYRLAAEAAGLGEGETWVVERLDSPSGGLLSLFARSDQNGSAEDPTVSGLASTHPLCLGSGAILAYHGDPARLCLPGR